MMGVCGMRQRIEKYVPDLPTAEAAEPRCVIRGCERPVMTEIHVNDYGRALALFRNIYRRRQRRQKGDARLFICCEHYESSPPVRQLQWQELLFAEREQP